MGNPIIKNEPRDDEAQATSKRKNSVIWEHVTLKSVDVKCTTSHLKQHVTFENCPQMSSRTLVSNTNGALPKKRYISTSGSAIGSLNQPCCRYEIAKMIIMHEYPLDMMDHLGFLDCVRALQPQFNVLSRDTIESDCSAFYAREKQALSNRISSIPGRVSLSLDMWSTDQSVCYVCIAGQFIDNNWKLNRKILGVKLLSFPESGSIFNHAVLSCITEWNLESKLFTVSLDESFSNETVTKYLRGILSSNNPLVLKGQLMISSCYSRVLTHLAQDALISTKETVKKVRDIVKYVVTAESQQKRFNDLKQKLQVPSTKSLDLDSQTQWNTTYHMLVAASELKEVFPCLDDFEPSYIKSPSMEEWKEVEVLCVFLKLLFDAANILVGPTFLTTDVFFHEVWKIQLALTNASMIGDRFIRKLTKPMHERFSKYWKDNSLVFAIAVIMDPRFKMKLVEFSFSKTYSSEAENQIKVVRDAVEELYLDYVVQMLPTPTFVVKENENGNDIEIGNGSENEERSVKEAIFLSTDDGLSDFDIYISETASLQNRKSELDQYLEESVLPRVHAFDVLGWWKVNRQKYPTLSKMAFDILCIPVSTVSQEFVFDSRRKKMNRYQCSLSPSTLESLVCAKDWLQHGSS
uniref:zinc finger BED domain-containing protein DAYSLEEPER-like n=1 Tax=Erigeron canadensis TaxID=72917 RepID=UPI001CB8E069|nr:zinc finger BED domain-containing protein DAYSLEEPER-like [Erigeron canadensis]